jgi:hypothetical protein
MNEGESNPNLSDAATSAVNADVIVDIVDRLEASQIAERQRQYPTQTRRMRPLKECIPPRTATGNSISYQAAWKWCTSKTPKVYCEPRGGRIWVDKVSFDAQLRLKGIEPLPD